MQSNLGEQLMSGRLLEWYDVHARSMPWRTPPEERQTGELTNAYNVWLSEIMLQQTTVAAVKGYFERFIRRWPTISDLAKATDSEVMGEWAGLGYYARARNLLKCARIVEADFDGKFPDDYALLLKMPGIGPYTAAAISAIAFDRPETVVDGNVERVIARLFGIHTPLPQAKSKLTELAKSLTPLLRPGDYAQAIMDLGATICKPKRPTCGVCPWRDSCKARILGNALELPKKLPKKQNPTRYGIVYFVEREDGAVLLETRPENGLLGGMLCWPGSTWTDTPTDNPPMETQWTSLHGEVRHTFTHFNLRLHVKTALVSMAAIQKCGHFVSKQQFQLSDLPTVMRKVYNLVRATTGKD